MERKRGWNKKIRKEVCGILLSDTHLHLSDWYLYSPYIAAIKYYRSLTSCSLKDAKDYVESLPEYKIYLVIRSLDRD